MKTKKRLLILSGGGSNGAFQVGALKAIEEMGENFLDYDIVGNSVGALNGLALFYGKIDELEAIWRDLTNKKVFKGNSLIRRAFNLLSKGSLMDNKPLSNLLSTFVLKNHKNRIKSFKVACTNISPRYYFLKELNFAKASEVHKYVLASTVIPIYWPNKGILDGGMYEIIPTNGIKFDTYDKVIVISANNPNYYNELTSKRWYHLLFWVIDTLIHSNLMEDFNNVKRISKNHKDFTFIYPERNLGSNIDFSTNKNRELIYYGYQLTKNKINNGK